MPPPKKTKGQKKFEAAVRIQWEQKNRHDQISMGWAAVNLNDSRIRGAILDAKKNGTLEKWEVDQFVSGNDGMVEAMPGFQNNSGIPSLMAMDLPMPAVMHGALMPAHGLPNPPIAPEKDCIVINGEQIRIGGESQWPPGALDRFRATLKPKAPAASEVVQEEKASFPTDGAVAKPAVSTVATPSGAPKQANSERAVSVGETLYVSTTQKKSVPPLLSKAPTGSNSMVGSGHAASALMKQNPNSSSGNGDAASSSKVVRIRPNPPKEKVFDEDGFEVVSQKKAARK